MKRVFDLLLVILAAPLLVPIIAILTVLVRAKLGTPVFFVQTRPGMGERPFNMVKFRTMTDARDEQGNLLPDEIRLTPFGQFLRRTSLDELPELWNVFKGEMSLVGPRPLLMQYLPLYTARQRRRHEVRPGVTGLAQVKGRNALSWDEKFDYDVRYVEQWSLWLDIKIIALTVIAVLRRDGISNAAHATMPPFQGETTKGR